jgi:oxalate decarboxylase/phosphoglucose isomerase-like protein (cupin superfamily)
MSRYFIRPETVTSYGFDWGQLALTVGPTVNGATAFSGGIVTVQSGGGHSRHNHPGSEEIILVMAGTGAQMVEDDDGTPITQDVGPGCTVYVPEGRFHSTLNTGAGPMTLFVVYAPAGPEQLLRELPDFRLVPPAG